MFLTKKQMVKKFLMELLEVVKIGISTMIMTLIILFLMVWFS